MNRRQTGQKGERTGTSLEKGGQEKDKIGGKTPRGSCLGV